MAYYVIQRPTITQTPESELALSIGQAVGRTMNRQPRQVDQSMIQRALAGLGTADEVSQIASAFGIQGKSAAESIQRPMIDAGAAGMALPGVGTGLPENAFQGANMGVSGGVPRSPVDALREFFGITQQEAARKMAGFGADGDSAITYRQALQGGIEGKYDAEYIKRNFPDKDPAEIEGALDRSKPISRSAGFREGGGLEAFGSNRVAKISDSTRSVIENLKIYGVKGLKDFLSDTDAMREAGVDPAAVIEYYGDSIKKHGLTNMVPSDLRKHL